jgi:hypothetical protein
VDLVVDPESQKRMRAEIAERMREDRKLLDVLRSEIRPLRDSTRRIQPRTTTSISLVGTDGGNNRLEFDPFLVQLVRVVDSSNNEYCLEAITPTTSITTLSRRQFDSAGKPATALGQMMAFLGVSDLTKLSHMIRRNNSDDRPTSPSWVQVYRELVEWAIIFSLVRTHTFGSDTLIVCDGLLRTKVFAGELFRRLLDGFKDAISTQFAQRKRRIYLVGVAKHNSVLSRYRLAMALEQILTTPFPAYVDVPRDLERKSYVWGEWARGQADEIEEAELPKFVGGKLYFVKFGNHPRDPVWPVDLFESQVPDAQLILGSMLGDATNGFPVPSYPQCLQKAHENAALVDFDFTVFQDYIFDGIRDALGTESPALDVFRLQDADPAQRRYS